MFEIFSMCRKGVEKCLKFQCEEVKKMNVPIIHEFVKFDFKFG